MNEIIFIVSEPPEGGTRPRRLANQFSRLPARWKN